ncbi:MAG: M1 family metallopeptidase [Nocardioides sp.]|uniref:M1 family metallopeptidase n=1 Tax=Nocardioides sp. TaxID=35761 RepID=UPI003F02B79A
MTASPGPAPHRPRARTLLAATALVLGAVAVPAATAGPTQPVDGAAGVGDPYWPLDGNGGYDVTRYRIENRWSFDTRTLRGRTAVDLVATDDLTSFSLDFLLPVSQVAVDGVPARFQRAGRGHELRVTPAEPLAAGTAHTVRVRYAGRPGRQSYAGAKAWLQKPGEVVAMGEPHMAPWWFPSNDHPTDKALFEVAVTVPRGKEVVSNGRLVGRTTGKRSVTWRWRADEPMATYLAFFAAGDFAIERGADDGLPWLNAVSQQLSPASQRRATRQLRRSAPIVRWLEKDLGPYPFSVTGGLVTSISTGFALENQTRPTYPEPYGDMSLLMVHELAHQWFGDAVSVRRWRDIWLNEGFASYMEWRWMEKRWGLDPQEQLLSTWQNLRGATTFWSVPIGDPGPGRVFDWAVYERGAMTLQALRHRIGDEVFLDLLRAWAGERPGPDATVEEFEALATQMSGEDLSGFFDAWLRTPERPARTVANGLV